MSPIPPAPERWLPVPRWPGYEASDRGRVRSVPRRLTDGRWHSGGMLTPRADRDGYLIADLKCGKRKRTVRVHVLVLETFRGRCPPGMEGCHNDSNKLNNWLTNLRWDTHAANEADKLKKLA